MSATPQLLQVCCPRADGSLYGHPCACPAAQLFWRWWSKEGEVAPGQTEEEALAAAAPTVSDFWGDHEWFGPWWLERDEAACAFFYWGDAAFGLWVTSLVPGLAYRVTIGVRRMPLWSEPGECQGLYGVGDVEELAPREFEFTADAAWALLGTIAPADFDPADFALEDFAPEERLVAAPVRGWAYGAYVKAVEWLPATP